MISRRFTLIYVVNLLSAAIGYVGLVIIARLTLNSEELLGLVGFASSSRSLG